MKKSIVALAVSAFITISEHGLHLSAARLYPKLGAKLEDHSPGDGESFVEKDVLVQADPTTLVDQFPPGPYDVQDGYDPLVRFEIGLDSSEVAKLPHLAAFRLLRAEYVESIHRVRGEIEKPYGWITLHDTEDPTFQPVQNREKFCKARWSCTYHYDKCTTDTDGNCVAIGVTTTTTTTTNPADDYALGSYDAVQDLVVRSGSDVSSVIVGNLKAGQAVKVINVEYIASVDKVRAEILKPHGWITLLDTSVDSTRNSTLTDRAKFCTSLGSIRCLWNTYHGKCHLDKDNNCVPYEVTTTTTTTTNPADFFPLGGYDSQQDLLVRAEIGTESAQVGELKKGASVNVLRVEYLWSDFKVRAEIEHPRGWITLLDTAVGSSRNSTLTNREKFCASLGKLNCKWQWNKCYLDDIEDCLPHEITTTTTTTSTTTTTTTTTLHPLEEFNFPGVYDVERSCAVTETVDLGSTEIKTLQMDHEVWVEKVEYLEADTRVRAKIKDPEGWITLRDVSNNTRFASSRQAHCKEKYWTCNLALRCYWKDPDCLPNPLRTTTTRITTTTTTQTGLTTTGVQGSGGDGGGSLGAPLVPGEDGTTTTTSLIADKTLPLVQGADGAEEQKKTGGRGGDGGAWIWVVGSFVTVLVLGAIIKVGMTIASTRGGAWETV